MTNKPTKYYIEWAVLMLLTLLILISSLIRVDYAFTAPGYNDEVIDFIQFDTPTSLAGSLHTTSVIHYEKTTMLQYYTAQLFNEVDIDELSDYYDYIDLDDLTVRSFLMKDDSIATSIIVAANLAGETLAYESYTAVYLTRTFLDRDTLAIGDYILTVNDIDVETFDFSTVECDETVTFKVLRDGQNHTFDVTKKDIDGTCQFGITLGTFSVITDNNLPYDIIENNTGGPSGGIMQALYAYTQFTQTDLTNGYKIAGTGTIDLTGNAGPIGGIEQKIYTAIHNDIDIFFVPYLSDDLDDNYIVARRLLDTLETDMDLIPIQTLDDVITHLNNLESSDAT
ncbi:MAG: hypothetical protein K9L26_02195 [Candidatus Izimaplasma sp.]|nr:hypothetical protein [Candidatus Izimaplasma bacterium]